MRRTRDGRTQRGARVLAARISRRRVLSIAAATAGLAAAVAAGIAPRATLHRWRGRALGADASIALHHPDATAARRLLDACVAEIGRLERVFSLYREDSALVRLNRAGRLKSPPLDLVRLLSECRAFSVATDGAFDATVQPLWRLYAQHFARSDADPRGPSERQLAGARALVDYRAVNVEAGEIVFAHRGMSVTLNGVAQGYITDRVADLLRDGGLDSALVHLGETRAIGPRPEGRPWRIAVPDPLAPERPARVVDVESKAVATSGGYGTPFDRDGRHHHLFDPGTGTSANHYMSVSVIAARATTADALSTALAVTSPDRTRACLRRVGCLTAIFVRPDHRVVTLSG
ncbi:MAG: FAD:protein FMN transferase [Alphaproteobacteria bacterium]